MNAAREGSVPCVQNLLKAGARLEDLDWNGDSAFAQALMASRTDTAEVLINAGAKDFRMTANTGRPVDADAEPFKVVKEYIAAVHAGDLETMARLVPASSLKMLHERIADLPVWQSMRPKEPRLAGGWMTDASATLTVQGTTPMGEWIVAYHLETTEDGWRIRREWFPDVR